MLALSAFHPCWATGSTQIVWHQISSKGRNSRFSSTRDTNFRVGVEGEASLPMQAWVRVARGIDSPD